MGDKMKNDTRIFQTYLVKAVSSPMFIVGILGITAICFSSLLNEIPNDLTTQMLIVKDFTALRRLFTVICSLPFSANFANEWENDASTHYIMRCGVKKYLLSNVAVNFIVSTVCVFVGMIIFFVVFSFFVPLPLYLPQYGDIYEIDEMLIYSVFPYSFVIVECFVFSLSCGMWSTFGVMLSAFLPNKYIAICSPLIANYVIERFTLALPDPINLVSISTSRVCFGNAAAALAYCMVIPVILSSAFGLIFFSRAKRRISG